MRQEERYSFPRRINNISFQLSQGGYKQTNSNQNLNEVFFLGKSWQNYGNFLWKTRSVKREMLQVAGLALPDIE